MGTLAGRVILFGIIPTSIPDTTPVITPPTTQTDTTVIPTETPIITPTIPPSPNYTLAFPDYSHASDTKSDPYEDSSSGHIPSSQLALSLVRADLIPSPKRVKDSGYFARCREDIPKPAQEGAVEVTYETLG
nr:hypothetical protein [Tanacetum cinerariifolium]